MAVVIIFPLILQTVIKIRMLSVEEWRIATGMHKTQTDRCQPRKLSASRSAGTRPDIPHHPCRPEHTTHSHLTRHYEWLLHRKLLLFGHTCHTPDDQLVKKVLLGSVDGVWQKGRPPKKWTDNITEWTVFTLCEAVRLSQDRETRKKIVFGRNGC